MRKQSGSFKRLIRKYEFLLEDWKDVEDIATSANQEFMREIVENRPEGISERDYTVDDSEDDEPIEETESDRVLKKLFRQIVLQCHPDRLIGDFSELEKIRRISLYEQAISAHDDKNWALMVITAIKLDVELPEEAEDMVDKIEEEAQELERKISSTTSGITWQFYHADADQKSNILNNYLAALVAKNNDSRKPKKESKLILGVGHPRTGTGYTAKLLQSWGLDVGHETMGEHGTVDWSLSTGVNSIWQKLSIDEHKWKHIIYCVRDPRDSIPSIVYTEDVVDVSVNFRKRHGVGKSKFSNPIERAIESMSKWDRFITKLEPNISFRIEDESKDLYDYLMENGAPVEWSSEFIGVKQNSRNHPKWDEMILEFGKLSGKYKIMLNRYCSKYGYDLILT